MYTVHDATAVSVMIWVDDDVILAKIWGKVFLAVKAQQVLSLSYADTSHSSPIEVLFVLCDINKKMIA